MPRKQRLCDVLAEAIFPSRKFRWIVSFMSSYESALVVLVPESDAVVGSFRDRYDPSAAEGVPAHITLLYPFKSPDAIDDATLRKLSNCFLGHGPIQFSLSAMRRLPTAVLYLAPQPDEPFRQLTLAIWSLFPQFRPMVENGLRLYPISRRRSLRMNSSSLLLLKSLRRRRTVSCRSMRLQPKWP